MNTSSLDLTKKRFGLTNDVMFKIVFGTRGSERLLCRLLNALLEYEGDDTIMNLEILNPILTPDRPLDKTGILDIKAEARSGKIFSIEVQNQHDDTLIKRILFYLAKNYAEQIKRGKVYQYLQKTIGLWILGQDFLVWPNFSPEPDIHNYYLFKHGKSNNVLTDLLELHFVELSKFKDNKEHTERTRFENWLYLLKFGENITSIEDLPENLKKEEGIEEAVNKMMEANTDDTLRHYMLSREMGELDERSRLYGAEKRARENTIREIAKVLLSTNVELDIIIASTGLTQEEILNLQV
jgi:predicted transposase/invertase (TIGR01784 family)